MNLTIINTLLRSYLKLKHSSLINLVGLSLGFAILLAIIFFIREELLFNKFHDNLENMYCIFTHDDRQTDKIGWNESVPALPAALREEYPEVLDAALIQNGAETFLVSTDDKKFYEPVQLTEPNVFNIFSFPIKLGAIPQEVKDNRVLALSEKATEKYFGDQNPVGKQLLLNNGDPFTVIAVFEDIPENSSIRFDIWAPVGLLEERWEGYLTTWYNLSFHAYVLLDEHASYTLVNTKLIDRIQQSHPDSHERAQLYPFRDLYLERWGKKKGVNMMMLIAAIILVIVTLNFINLQSAEAFKRVKDFGIRKINGARSSYIYKLLIGEALIYVFIAILVGVTITHFFSDYLLSIIGKQNTHVHIISLQSIVIAATIGFIIAILSGLLPGLTIISVSPNNSLKGKIREKLGVSKMRYAFTCLQFCMAIGLIICLIVANKQVHFLRTKNLGFEKEYVISIRLRGELREKYDLLKKELDRNPSIVSSTVASRSPIGIYWNGGGWGWEGKPDDFDPQVTFIETDEYFQETFGINMKEGEYLTSEVPGVVINKTFANMVAPKGSALNKLLKNEGEGITVPVAGVIDDFHFKPLNRKIGALMLIPRLGYDEMKYLFVKISPTDIKNSLSFIETTVAKLNPDFPYENKFLDAEFDRLYKGEERLRNQMMFFSIMAMFISCMGLWGILVFTLKQRTQEIGIRKVNGARVYEILRMINTQFLKMVAIAFVIACPVSWYLMDRWLQNFAYKTDINWWVYSLAGLVSLAIAFITVSWQSWKAARMNPVKALRYE